MISNILQERSPLPLSRTDVPFIRSVRLGRRVPLEVRRPLLLGPGHLIGARSRALFVIYRPSFRFVFRRRFLFVFVGNLVARFCLLVTKLGAVLVLQNVVIGILRFLVGGSMDPFITGSLIMGGAGLLGGALGEFGANNRSEESLAFAREQMAQQREFAQQGVRWRVADAKAAGVHPLYAMGAQVTPYSSVNFSSESPSYGMAQAVSDMGQNIGRAVQAKQTGGERLDTVMTELRLKNMQLNNDLIESQIARNYGVSLPPPMPGITVEPLAPPEAISSAIGNVPGTKVEPVEMNASTPGIPSKQAGAVNDWTFTRTADGGLTLTPSKDVKELTEDNFIQEVLWSLRNQVVPHFSPEARANRQPSLKEFPLPPGYVWDTSWPYTTWYPKKVGRR